MMCPMNYALLEPRHSALPGQSVNCLDRCEEDVVDNCCM